MPQNKPIRFSIYAISFPSTHFQISAIDQTEITHLRSYFYYTLFSKVTQVRLRYRVILPIIFPEVMENDSQEL